MTLFERVHVPSFAGATQWLNSEPLGTAELRGHVVVVNFWTWTCINWLRQEPYVRAWSQAYRDDGLIVIGVHTPEFAFEHDIDGVRRTTSERAIGYPIAVDNDYAVWNAFANRYWPALYFVDRDGIIRDQHFGEGRYEQSERVIQKLLGIERQSVPVEGLGVEAAADWEHLRTQETYLGYWRSGQFASPQRPALDDSRALRPPGGPAPQPLGPRRRVDDRGRERRPRPSQRDHRLPVPRTRRASRAVSKQARTDSVSRAPRRRASRPVTRRRRRRGRPRRTTRRPRLPVGAPTRRRQRPSAGDHVPRARRRGVRVHIRLVRCRSQPGEHTCLAPNQPRKTRPGMLG